MPRKKIVFVAYGGGHINMMIPVIKKLQNEHMMDLVILGLTTAGETLQRHGIPYIGFKDILTEDDDRALLLGKKLVGEPTADMVVPYEESVAYMGLSYMDLETRYGVDEAEKIYTSGGGRQAFYPLTIMERFLRKEAPDLVVATNSPRAERAAITMAGKLGIHAICMVDLFGLQEMQWICQPCYADRVCVLCDYVKENFVRAGRQAEEIVITGNPAFDHLAEYRYLTADMRRKKSWDDNLKVILWASQPEPAQHPFAKKKGDPGLPRKIDEALINIMSGHPDWHLVIRPHPSESIIYNELPENVEISSSSEPLYELLAAVDVVVTMSSTVGLEAALIDKPLISLDISIFTDDAPYSSMGISRGVDDMGDLEKVLRSVLIGEWHSPVKLTEIGHATDKVLSVIHEYV